MWPLMTFTLGFRGLMVIHRVETVEPNFFEVGVVQDDLHFLRINTIKNGVVSAIDFLEVNHEHRTWNLEVDNPIGSGVSTYTQGGSGDIDRERHQYERDFRWLTDLGELFENIEEKLDTSRLLPVLRINNGVFSTRVKSTELEKIVAGTSEPFGCIATVVVCDIPVMAGGSVRMVEEATGRTLFTFELDENTIYEFANTPAEVPNHAGGHADSGHAPDGDDDADHGDEPQPVHAAGPPDPCQGEHFKSYYKLFKQPNDEISICFKKLGPQTAPDPATCGAVGAGAVKGPFGN
jgi:hypothetical protein